MAEFRVMSLEFRVIKKQFPIFKHHKKLVYLDNAATTQTPQAVIEAMNFYYEQRRANIHRGTYQLSGLATQLYEESRDTVAEFLQAFDKEIIFTSGATHGLNLLAYTLCKDLKPGDNIVLTRMEHHANLVPWQVMSKRYGFQIRYIELEIKNQKSKIKNPYELNFDSAKNSIDINTKIVSFCHISNTLGVINPAKELIALARRVGAITIVDAAQSVAHMPIDVKALDCDFLVFSGHKMYGPTGIGVLFGKKERLEKLDPFFFGGDMIREVRYDGATWADLPWKFEGGTPNIAGAIGLAAAIRFIEHIGLDTIRAHENELRAYALAQLELLPKVTVVGPGNHLPTSPYRVEELADCPIISFGIEGIHPHDIAQILDHHGVAVRAGHHCTMPLMKYLGAVGTTRLSFGLYNTKKDVDRFMIGMKDVIKKFS